MRFIGLWLAFGVATPAFAHHPAAVSRVTNQQGSVLGLESLATGTALPRLELGV